MNQVIEVTSSLPWKCFFVNADKYLEGYCSREKRSNCIQVRADGKICKVDTEQNNTTVMAIAPDELVAKEICYHTSCYRMYTKHVYLTQLQSEIDTEDMKVWTFLLSNIYLVWVPTQIFTSYSVKCCSR